MPFNNARRAFVERRAGVTNALDLPADPLAAFPAHRAEIRIGYARVSARVPGEERVFAAGGNPSYDEDSQGWLWTRN